MTKRSGPLGPKILKSPGLTRTESDRDRKISRNQEPEDLENLRPSRRSVDARFTGREIWIF